MNNIQKYTKSLMAIFVILLAATLSGCFSSSNSNRGGQSVSPDDPLTVVAIGPVNDAVAVGTNSMVTATFNMAINADTLDDQSFILSSENENQVPGTVTLDAATNTAVFQSSAAFTAVTLYTATITTAVHSVDGRAMATDYQWSFTTGEGADTTAPTVTTTDPADGASGVALNRSVSVSFSEAMLVSSLTDDTFQVTGAGSPVAGSIDYVGTTAVFTPLQDLLASTTYTTTLTTGITDLAGISLAAPFILTFTTGTNVAQGPAPVILGTAGDYVILAKSGISTTPGTNITGDIAVSPEALSYITGFDLTRVGTYATSGLVTGEVFAADLDSPTPSLLTTAVSDMETAYTDAAGRANPDFTELYAGDISGRTLEPGLYKWSSGLLISTSVTLDGSENDVWILQIAENLTVGNGVAINLTGGAMAKNVFWQVAGSTTFGTTSNVKGIFLSQTLIEMETGAVLNGRALAQTAVTLDANEITEPAE